MKKLQFLAWPKLCTAALLGAGALFMASCAQDGYDDKESWESTVTNTQMTSPDADKIVITPSADGMSMKIEWPVVNGAGGYQLTLTDISDAANPVQVLNQKVDGCSLENVPREEDVRYKLELRALGKSSAGNTDAPTSIEKLFSTTTETTATIPNNSDLAEWFAENPVPNTVDMQYYDLIAGGNYTLNSEIDFEGRKVTIRSQSKNNRATVTYGSEGSFLIGNGFGLKYINFELGSSTKPFIRLSATPGVPVDPDHNNHYIITEPISIMSCNVNNLKSYFLFDGGSEGKKYCLKTVLVNNCLVKVALDASPGSDASVFDMYKAGGFINDITLQNTTFWNAKQETADFKYFIRYANAGRADRAGFTSASINFVNCTLYKMCKAGQMCNHSGFDGHATANYNVTKNIFVDCGSNQVARRIIGRAGTGTIIFNYNTYKFNDEIDTDQSGYDTGTHLTTDPGFADPANGDFTISGSAQLANQTGDPRWIK